MQVEGLWLAFSSILQFFVRIFTKNQLFPAIASRFMVKWECIK